MKRKLVFSAMLVCMLAIGLALVGCDNGSTGGNNTDPKTITITGITGKTGTAQIYVLTPSNGQMEADAWAKGNISNNSVTFTLLNYDKDTPWTGSGSFVLNVIMLSDESQYMYTNGKTLDQLGITSSTSQAEAIAKFPKYNISSASSTIPLSQFFLMP